MIELDAPDQRHIGVFCMVRVRTDVFNYRGPIKIVRVSFDAVEQCRVQVAGNLNAGAKQIFRQDAGQRPIIRPHIHQLCAPLPFIRMMVENNLRPESIRKMREKRRLRIQERRHTVRCNIHLIHALNIKMQTGHQLDILLTVQRFRGNKSAFGKSLGPLKNFAQRHRRCDGIGIGIDDNQDVILGGKLGAESFDGLFEGAVFNDGFLGGVGFMFCHDACVRPEWKVGVKDSR